MGTTPYSVKNRLNCAEIFLKYCRNNCFMTLKFILIELNHHNTDYKHFS